MPDGREVLVALGLMSPEQAKLRGLHKGKVGTKTSTGPFVGWDGEGVTIDGRHKYVLLANSYGHTLYDPRGIPTVRALDMLCNQPAKDPKPSNHVMFGGSYDANMILADLGYYQLGELAETGQLDVHKFRIRYRPRKFLHVIRYRPGSQHVNENRTGSIMLWDVLGFFQTSFVKSLQLWLPEVEEVIAYIADMKKQRSGFTLEQKREIQRYCVDECKLLVDLMEKLRKMAKRVGYCPTRWDGAGALGSTMLRKNKVKDYKVSYVIRRDGSLQGNIPFQVNLAAQSAYFGGRIELVRFGNYNLECYTHDIVSAYPAAMVDLPCLAHGKWRFTKRPRKGSFSVVHVTFGADSILEPFYPLPWRNRHGFVFFPPSTEGWYWMPEVEAMREHYFPSNYTIHGAWTFVPECDHKPFSFIPKVFDYRRKLKEQGHHGNVVLKLGLNSLYGKLAQQVGWRTDWSAKTKAPPTYHCLEWAGWITSKTRATMFQAAMLDPTAVVAFETDGLHSTEAHPVGNTGSDLGMWDIDRHDGLTYVQSGVYWLRDGDTWKAKYRGLDTDTLNRDMVLEGWRRGRTSIEATTTRFRGMMTSTVSPERFTEWRQWVTEKKTIELAPNGKRVHSPSDCVACMSGTKPSRALHHTMATGGDRMSEPHPLVWKDGGVTKTLQDPYYRAEMEYDEEDEEVDLPL